MQLIREWFTHFFCDHVSMQLNVVGAASLSGSGEVSMTIELTCPACGYLNHRTLDATAAMREGLQR
jgi:hypothetical protein